MLHVQVVDPCGRCSYVSVRHREGTGRCELEASCFWPRILSSFFALPLRCFFVSSLPSVHFETMERIGFDRSHGRRHSSPAPEACDSPAGFKSELDSIGTLPSSRRGVGLRPLLPLNLRYSAVLCTHQHARAQSSARAGAQVRHARSRRHPEVHRGVRHAAGMGAWGGVVLDGERLTQRRLEMTGEMALLILARRVPPSILNASLPLEL